MAIAAWAQRTWDQGEGRYRGEDVLPAPPRLLHFPKRGRDYVRFHLHPVPGILAELTCEAPVLEFREVKDSGGHAEQRPFIRTLAKVGKIKWEIDLSLSNREGMKFRMLLGRQAVAGKFCVDPGKSYLIGKSLKNEY